MDKEAGSGTGYERAVSVSYQSLHGIRALHREGGPGKWRALECGCAAGGRRACLLLESYHQLGAQVVDARLSAQWLAHAYVLRVQSALSAAEEASERDTAADWYAVI